MNVEPLDPTDWLARVVPRFHELPADEKKAIGDFCLLWTLFESQCLERNGNVEKIKAFVNRLGNRLEKENNWLNEPLAYFRHRYVDQDGFTYHFRHLRLSKDDSKNDVEPVLLSHVEDGPRVLIALLIIVYRFRNNLFHGEKWQYDIFDQATNFRTANKVLMWCMDLERV